MELKQIKELMAAMERAQLKRLKIKEQNGFELEMEKQEAVTYTAAPAPRVVHEAPQSFAPPHGSPHAHYEEPKTGHASREEKNGKYVTSPMVGTFYSAPSPEDPPFVKVGDRVDENSIVCIIEAMKVMNEVKAGVSGVVAEINLSNGNPVEFGTKIFRIT